MPQLALCWKKKNGGQVELCVNLKPLIWDISTNLWLPCSAEWVKMDHQWNYSQAPLQSSPASQLWQANTKIQKSSSYLSNKLYCDNTSHGVCRKCLPHTLLHSNSWITSTNTLNTHMHTHKPPCLLFLSSLKLQQWCQIKAKTSPLTPRRGG